MTEVKECINNFRQAMERTNRYSSEAYMIFPKSRRIWNELKPPLLFYSSIVFFIVVIHFAIFHREPIEKRYGFRTDTPDLRWFPCHIEPIVIKNIQKGMAFDRAGFREKDILVSPDFYSAQAFLNSLKKPRGTVIEFRVIPWDKFKSTCDFDSTGKTEKRILVAP